MKTNEPSVYTTLKEFDYYLLIPLGISVSLMAGGVYLFTQLVSIIPEY
jgi:hypothetical protein